VEKKPEHTPPSRRKDSGSIKTLLFETALRLYDFGLNIVPTDKDKKPLGKWSPRERLPREELVKQLERADGIAIAGGLNPWYDVGVILFIVDVDNPRVLEDTPSLKRLIGETVSWKTGPRCPKCYFKELDVLEEGSRFRCRSCYVEFMLEEAPRGLGALFTASREAFEKLLKGTVRFKGVELLVNNYQLIPPSKHKTGVLYEWVRPPDFTLPNLGIYSLEDVELEAIWEELKKLGASKPVWVEAEKRVAAEVKVEGATATRQARVEELRELSPDVIGEIVEHLRGLYQPGYRQHLWLNLSGAGAKCEVSPLSIARALKQLYEESGDSDPIKVRASAIVYTYKKAGIDVDAYAGEFEELFGVRPYGLEREIGEEAVKGISGIREIAEALLGEEKALEVVRELERLLGCEHRPQAPKPMPQPPGGDVIEELLARGEYLEAVRVHVSTERKPNMNFIADSIARHLIASRVVKTVMVNGKVLGTYCYKEGYYYECEEELLGELEKIYEGLGLARVIRSYAMLRNIFSKIVEDATKHPGGFNHTLLLFKNAVLDWRCLVYEGTLCIETPKPELMVLHRIPWEIDVSVLEKHLNTPRGELFRAVEGELGELVDIFKQWVGDRWHLLVEIIGYTLLAGEYPLSKAIMLVGEGGNGKSVYLELVRRLVGVENCTSVKLQDLAGDSRFSASQLYSKMANIYADLPSTLMRETGQFKILTGQDPISADRKYREPITFVNYAKLLFSCNELPRVEDMTTAFWRRWIVVEFPNRFQQNEEFKRMLFKELLPKVAPKLLAYALLAVAHVVRSGKFSFEESEADYREKWLRDTNSVYAFVLDMLKLGVLEKREDGRVETGELYQMYVKYCNMEERDPMDKRKFTIEMERLGYRKVKVRNTHYYKGLNKLKEYRPESLEAFTS
jgi:P4 family phage/plasmid primase-like protien